MSYADFVVSHEEEEECLFLCVSFPSILFLFKESISWNSSADYAQIPFDRIGHLSLPVKGNETVMTGFDQPWLIPSGGGPCF